MKYSDIILGDNQFLGVNHSSQLKAGELYGRFRNVDSIIEIIGAAYDAGVRDFMFTTHDRYQPVFEEICRSRMFPEMYYSPCLPYAHKYWNSFAENGYISTMGIIISGIGGKTLLSLLPNLVADFTTGLVALFIGVETLMCRGLKLRGVFLQNLAFDLLVAMELYAVIEGFFESVINRMRVLPGCVTMNHSAAIDVLCHKIGIRMPWVCANNNSIGFRMHPSQEACGASFALGISNNIAMSIMASGLCEPEAAIRHVVCQMRRGFVQSVVFGSSSKSNITQTVGLVRGCAE